MAERPHDRDAHGRTALHRAAMARDRARCIELLKDGADAAARDDRGKTPAELVSVGDPSCDPEDCAEWRSLRSLLEAAARDAKR